MIALLAFLTVTVGGFVYWRHRVRLRKRRDLLSTTFEDRTSGVPRGPGRWNPKPSLSPKGGG